MSVDTASATARSPSIPVRPEWMTHRGRPLTGQGVHVAVVDSGWFSARTDPRVLPGVALDHGDHGDHGDRRVIRTTLGTEDRLGHGTRYIQHVLQLAREARVYPVRVFEGGLSTSASIIAAAIDWAVDRGIRVVNLSLGTRETHDALLLYGATARAREAGTIVVAAAAPDGGNYPAAFDTALSVGSAWLPSPFEHRCRPDELVECVASGRFHGPGPEDPRLAGRDGGPPSFAAPRVAGIDALLLERSPGLDLDGVRRELAQLTQPPIPA